MFCLVLLILIMSVYWYSRVTQVGGGVTYPRSVNIFGKDSPCESQPGCCAATLGKADSLPFPEFRKYWYRNYGEMTDPFYPNYWNTYWDDSAYFS